MVQGVKKKFALSADERPCETVGCNGNRYFLDEEGRIIPALFWCLPGRKLAL